MARLVMQKHGGGRYNPTMEREWYGISAVNKGSRFDISSGNWVVFDYSFVHTIGCSKTKTSDAAQIRAVVGVAIDAIGRKVVSVEQPPGFVQMAGFKMNALVTGSVVAGDPLCNYTTKEGCARAAVVGEMDSGRVFAQAYGPHSGAASTIPVLILPWRI